MPTTGTVSIRARMDALYTYTYAIAPAFIVLAIPVALLGQISGVDTRTYLPFEDLLWALVLLAPSTVVALVYASDLLEGHDHRRREYVAVVTLWPYLLVQSLVFVTAFIEEFVLDRPSVYVTTSRSEAPADD
jgi:hypothetical protein